MRSIASSIALSISRVLEKYLDTAVKHYSTGMHTSWRSRGGTLGTDILLVDEVLAVGDARSEEVPGRMNEVRILARRNLRHHDMTISRCCANRDLARTRQFRHGAVETVIESYLSGSARRRARQCGYRKRLAMQMSASHELRRD